MPSILKHVPLHSCSGGDAFTPALASVGWYRCQTYRAVEQDALLKTTSHVGVNLPNGAFFLTLPAEGKREIRRMINRD